MVKEGLGELDLRKSFSVPNLAGEIPAAARDFIRDNRGNIAGAVLGAGIGALAMPGVVFAQNGGPEVSTERIGDLVKTLALPAILGTGNAYRAWYSASQDVERIQSQINDAIEETNAASDIQSAEDIVWQTVAKQLNLDPEASSEERQKVFSKIDQKALNSLRESAEEQLNTIPETVRESTAAIREMSSKRDKIWRRGAWRIPFEFGEGFLVGCFGMALLQPDGAPTMIEKFFNSTNSVEQAENGLYLSGYAFASWTALRAMWKLQHAAGGRGRARDDVKAHQKQVILDSGGEVKNNNKPRLSDQAKALAGDRVAQAKIKIKRN